MTFLKGLAKNNNKAWFESHRAEYEQVKDAGLDFVAEAGIALRAISTHVVADPKPNGGSMMRIFRDTRFAKDKSPYKTGLGFHFRHEDAGEEHGAPGFFLHVEPGASVLCAGMWHPPAEQLAAIRAAIAADGKGWAKAKATAPEWMGESLVRVPKGFDAQHAYADDLRRKDFVACTRLTDKQVLAREFGTTFVDACRRMAGANKWLADAVGAAW